MDLFLAMLLGSEYRVWRSMRGASEAEQARVAYLAKRWRSIQRTQSEADMRWFITRLDERTAVLVRHYPEPEWPLPLVPECQPPNCRR